MNHQMSSPYGYDVSPPNFGFDQGPSSNSFSFGMMSPLPPPPPPAPMPGFPGHMTQYSNMGQMPAGHMPAPLPRAKGQRRGVRRNPEAPKRPMSPYVTFVKDKWKTVHESLPGAAAKDVMRTLGEQWNALPEAEKEKWKLLSDNDKARYATEMQSFDGPSTVAVTRRGGVDGSRRKRQRKDPNAPKRGASAFLLFANEKRKALKDANPTLHNTEISRRLGAIWKSADDATKAPYVEAEAEARKQYGKAMEEYRTHSGIRAATAAAQQAAGYAGGPPAAAAQQAAAGGPPPPGVHDPMGVPPPPPPPPPPQPPQH